MIQLRGVEDVGRRAECGEWIDAVNDPAAGDASALGLGVVGRRSAFVRPNSTTRYLSMHFRLQIRSGYEQATNKDDRSTLQGSHACFKASSPYNTVIILSNYLFLPLLGLGKSGGTLSFATRVAAATPLFIGLCGLCRVANQRFRFSFSPSFGGPTLQPSSR